LTTPNVQSGQARPAGRRGIQRRRRLTAWPPRRLRRLGLRLAGAGLLAATGAVHLDLYLTGYRSIPMLGWLFLLQLITAFGLAAAVLATGSRLIAAAGAGFALATPCPAELRPHQGSHQSRLGSSTPAHSSPALAAAGAVLRAYTRRSHLRERLPGGSYLPPRSRSWPRRAQPGGFASEACH